MENEYNPDYLNKYSNDGYHPTSVSNLHIPSDPTQFKETSVLLKQFEAIWHQSNTDSSQTCPVARGSIEEPRTISRCSSGDSSVKSRSYPEEIAPLQSLEGHTLTIQPGRDDKILSTLTRIKAELPEPVSASSDGPLNQIHNQHPVPAGSENKFYEYILQRVEEETRIRFMQQQEKPVKKKSKSRSRHNSSHQTKRLQEHEIKMETPEEHEIINEKTDSRKIKRGRSYDNYKQEMDTKREKSSKSGDRSRSKRRENHHSRHRSRSKSRNKSSESQSRNQEEKVSVFSRIGHRARSKSNHRRRRSKSKHRRSRSRSHDKYSHTDKNRSRSRHRRSRSRHRRSKSRNRRSKSRHRKSKSRHIRSKSGHYRSNSRHRSSRSARESSKSHKKSHSDSKKERNRSKSKERKRSKSREIKRSRSEDRKPKYRSKSRSKSISSRSSSDSRKSSKIQRSSSTENETVTQQDKEAQMLKIRLEVEAMYTDAMNAMIVQKEQEVRNLQAFVSVSGDLKCQTGYSTGTVPSKPQVMECQSQNLAQFTTVPTNLNNSAGAPTSKETIPGLTILEKIPNLGALLTKLLAETGMPTNGVIPEQISQQNVSDNIKTQIPDLGELSPMATLKDPSEQFTAIFAPGRPTTARGLFPRISSERTGLPDVNMSVAPSSIDILTGSTYNTHEDVKPPKPDFHIFMELRRRYGNDFKQETDIRDVLHLIVTKPYASRFIQENLFLVSENDKEVFFQKLLPRAASLAFTPYANYVIQKLFEYGNEDQVSLLFQQMLPETRKMLVDKYGSRVVEKGLGYVSPVDHSTWVEEISKDLEMLIRDPNGNHVVQQVFETTTNPYCRGMLIMLERINESALFLCTERYGQKLIQRVITTYNDHYRAPVKAAVIKMMKELCVDSSGHSLVRDLIHFGNSEDREMLFQECLTNLVSLTKGNVSVKIVEYFIKNGTKEQIKAMAERLCWQNNLEKTLEDYNGCNIVEQILKMSCPQQLQEIHQKLTEFVDQIPKKVTVKMHNNMELNFQRPMINDLFKAYLINLDDYAKVRDKHSANITQIDTWIRGLSERQPFSTLHVPDKHVSSLIEILSEVNGTSHNPELGILVQDIQNYLNCIVWHFTRTKYQFLSSLKRASDPVDKKDINTEDIKQESETQKTPEKSSKEKCNHKMKDVTNSRGLGKKSGPNLPANIFYRPPMATAGIEVRMTRGNLNLISPPPRLQPPFRMNGPPCPRGPPPPITHLIPPPPLTSATAAKINIGGAVFNSELNARNHGW